ncbi:MAG: anhydro-N-acetylmuramic acid kinase [Gammaproteobacteria bacterium]|nr:anhydro-N-acetylmuramic acid kinase [Gammaproteobacteria bacterium]
MSPSELYMGLMSGTSMDGADAALVQFDEQGCRIVAGHGVPFPRDLYEAVSGLVAQPMSISSLDQLGELETRLGHFFADAALELLEGERVAASSVAAIGSHGQTIRHCPDFTHAFTWQLGDPNVIVARTRITTVADFRRRDLALGGQGAPLMPAFHKAVFSAAGEDRVVVNLGGMANVTILPREGEVLGFDTGPGNALMDIWSQAKRRKPFDEGGAWAASGRVHAGLLERFSDDPFFRKAPPKSTGREYFNKRWIENALFELTNWPSAEDIQATLLELTACSVSEVIADAAPKTERVLLCGGGVHNLRLVERLGELMPTRIVEPAEAHGIASDWVEAAGFAWLARQTLNGHPGNLPAVTGASRPAILGGIYRAR